MNVIRTPNRNEKEIVQTKNARLGKNITVTLVEYEPMFPRSTLCTITTKDGNTYHGVTMRGKGEADNKMIAEGNAFTRALNKAAGLPGF